MDDNKKYIVITSDSQLISGIKVYRIKALRDIYPTRNDCDKIRKGSLGGYVQSEKNLDQLGECWIHDGSFVMHQSVVKDNAQVAGYSSILLGSVVEDNAKITNSTLQQNCRVSQSATVVNSKLSNNIWLFDDVVINKIHASIPALFGRHYRPQRVQNFVESIVDAIGHKLSVQEAQKAINTLVMKWLKEQAGSRTRSFQYDLVKILRYLYLNAAELLRGCPAEGITLAQAIGMHPTLPDDFDHILSWLLFEPDDLINKIGTSPKNLTDALIIHYFNHPNCLIGEKLKLWHNQIFRYLPKAYQESTLRIPETLMTHYLINIFTGGRKRSNRRLSLNFSYAERRLLEMGDIMPILCRLPDFVVCNPHWLRVAYDVLISTQTDIDTRTIPNLDAITGVSCSNTRLFPHHPEEISMRNVLAPLRGTDASPVYRIVGHNSTGQGARKLNF